jgi:TonB family protein
MKGLTRILTLAAVLGMLPGAWSAASDRPAPLDLKKFPQPAGGVEELARKVVYPPSAKKDGVSGTVYVAAEILTDGTVGQTRIESGVRSDLDSAAATAVRAVRWIPGENEQGPVSAWVTIPVGYKLDTEKKKK